MVTQKVRWYQSLSARGLLGIALVLGILLAGMMIILNTYGKNLIAEEAYKLLEQSGNSITATLESRLREVSALTRSLATIAAQLPKNERQFRQILPSLIDFNGDLGIAGGGVWPEPYQFDSQRQRRSFFWGRSETGQLTYFDDYNQSERGYHREDWYVPARYSRPGSCFWSESYMDPFTLEPMVTCTVGVYEQRGQKSMFTGAATIDLRLNKLSELVSQKIGNQQEYAFLVDRNNRFITFPQPEKVKVKIKNAQEFITAKEFAQKENSFLPIAETLDAINQDLLQKLDPAAQAIAAQMTRETPRITPDTALLMATVLSDPLAKRTRDSHLYQRVTLGRDFLLEQPATAFIFHIAGTYWKFVIVKTNSAIVAPAQLIVAFLAQYSGAMILLILAGAFFAFRHFFWSPIAHAVRAVRSMHALVESKEYDRLPEVVIQRRSQDEIGHLTRIFEQMARQVIEQNEQLEHSFAEAHGLNAIFDNLTDGLLVIDNRDFVLKYNPAFLHLYHLAEDSLAGKSLFQISQLLPDVVRVIRQVQGRPYDIHSQELTLDNGRFGKAIAISVFRNYEQRNRKDILGTAILIRDITTEKEVDQMKTDFISTVSHELRTPLTSVLGFASIIREKLHDDILPHTAIVEHKKLHRSLKKVDANLEIIVAESERLTSLINDVLDIAKMEAGKIDWRMELIDMSAVVERALNATSSLFTKSGLIPRCEIDSELPLIVGDRDRLIQVVINLISNAVKFTPSGSVTCRVLTENDFVIVKVVDTGIGIAPEDCPKVFEKFKQVGNTLTDKPKGTGLGLSICVQIVEHHGGKIWVESELGKGSTFSFSLPTQSDTIVGSQPRFDRLLRQLNQQIGLGKTSASGGEKRILVVDDDPSIRELLRQELQGAGYRVFSSVNGVDAIHRAKEVRPDLILMDVMMPQMNGFDAAAVLRHDPETAHIPIIILSIIQDQERGYKLGIDRYLSKPIDKNLLLRDIGTLLEQGETSKKVLIVDRSQASTQNLSEVLQSHGYIVAMAQGDRTEIENALAAKPDIIIVDSGATEELALFQELRLKNQLEDVMFLFMGDNIQEILLPG
ncbi:MAG: response regulator [Oscillatoriales cyanobacterium SM2_2_1]|nr:response regulator [Oscillatoriales cyanobacterium SM2_2_1]